MGKNNLITKIDDGYGVYVREGSALVGKTAHEIMGSYKIYLFFRKTAEPKNFDTPIEVGDTIEALPHCTYSGGHCFGWHNKTVSLEQQAELNRFMGDLKGGKIDCV